MMYTQNVYNNKLDDIFNKYNNTYYGRIKMNFLDVQWNTYIDFNIENNNEDYKFK